METKFGIEIEIVQPRSISKAALAQALTRSGINTRSERLNHSTKPYWKLVTDGSCGWELVSPILEGVEGIKEVATALNTLKSLGCRTDSDCGLHVHLDARGKSFEQIKAFCAYWSIAESGIMDNLVSRDRREYNNYYCRPINQDWEAILATHNFFDLTSRTSVDNGRYRKLNLQSYFRYQSIEIRHLESSLDAPAVCGWIELQIAFFEMACSKCKTRNVKAFAKKSNPQRLNNIVKFHHQSKSFPTQKKIKTAVFAATGARDTKQLRRMFDFLPADLRRKASWESLYNRFCGSTSSTLDLGNWATSRTNYFETAIV